MPPLELLVLARQLLQGAPQLLRRRHRAVPLGARRREVRLEFCGARAQRRVVGAVPPLQGERRGWGGVG